MVFNFKNVGLVGNIGTSSGGSATYFDSFTSGSNWAEHPTDTGYAITGGKLVGTNIGRQFNVPKGIALDLTQAGVLGKSLDDTKWEIRVKLDVTVLRNINSSVGISVVLGVTNKDENFNFAGVNHIGVLANIHTGSSTTLYQYHQVYSSLTSVGDVQSISNAKDPVAQLYFMTIRRESATLFTYKLSTTAYGDGTFMTLSAIMNASQIGLDHLNCVNYSTNGTNNNGIDYTLDDLEVYDEINL